MVNSDPFNEDTIDTLAGFDLEFLQGDSKYVPSLGLVYKYPFNFLQIDATRKLAESHAYFDISINYESKSRTNLEIGMAIRFFNKDRGLCEEFAGGCNTDPNCTSVEEAANSQYASRIFDLDALKSLVAGWDAYEQVDMRPRFPWIPEEFLKPIGRVSLSNRYASQYRFWRGFLEFLIYQKKSNGDSSNQRDAGLVSKPLIYLGFMYYLQNALLTKGYRSSQKSTWEKVLQTRNMIITNFKALKDDTPEKFGDPKNFMFEYNPPFVNDVPKGDPSLRYLWEYHGAFFNKVLLKKPEIFDNYEGFFKGTFPGPIPPDVPYPND